ncbi:Uncharacterized protein APZ42_013649 [Daphnia magna]|uniref:Uncharacterized protein n=1 Tax=Daphnia magna TaxID=35525 RepID=A0A162QP57_9CRUS|nr:Uncharacterized protein APZ42_013649 [Daphnia magna]
MRSKGSFITDSLYEYSAHYVGKSGTSSSSTASRASLFSQQFFRLKRPYSHRVHVGHRRSRSDFDDDG